MLLVCFKHRRKCFPVFFFSESYKLFLISLAPRARADLLTFQVITGNVSPCKAQVFPDRLLPSVTPLCAQSHYHKSHRMLLRQLCNLVTPGLPTKRGQIPQCRTASQFMWTGQGLYMTQTLHLQTRPYRTIHRI